MTRTFEHLLSFSLWAIIVGLSVYFFIDSVAVYLVGYRSDNFVMRPFWISSHMIGGTFALLFGPVQFSKWLRNKYLPFHRLSGKIYIAGAVIVGLSALRLSVVSPCVPCRISLFILAVLVLVTSFSAWWAVRNGNITAHRQFMVRSYICILSFVAVRISGLVPLDFLFGQIEDPTFNRTVNEYFFSFVPLILGEIFMIWIPTLQGIVERITLRTGGMR